MAQNVLFPKTSLRTVQAFTMGQRKFFLPGGAPRGSRNRPNYPKFAFLSRFTRISWGIFHKLLLNSILKSIIVPLKLFFKLLWARKWPKIGPKCPFSLFLGIIFGVFAKTSLRTVQTSTMGHSLKFPAKEIFFGRVGLPVGPESAQINPKLHFCWDSHQFVGTFSISYLEIAS